MQVVLQVLGATQAAMPVINSEKLDSLLVRLLLESWVLQVKNDTDPVFVVGSNDAVMSVRSVCDQTAR